MAEIYVNKEQYHQTSSDCHRQVGHFRWDYNYIEFLLYLVTPIILITSAFLLVFASPSQGAAVSKENISCWFPAEFSSDWIDYGHQICLSDQAKLYEYNFSDYSIPDVYTTPQPVNLLLYQTYNVYNYFLVVLLNIF
ncbi:hypothetical protein EB796_012748 [Bugula neritina]|uniref:Innexin n=1 Tax=Bugula neritina TaxID=10212 RepID=A0A7J7JRI3_BUGNE|nr:hypothetical protein EB796_012748 [Bugula neritina]